MIFQQLVFCNKLGPLQVPEIELEGMVGKTANQEAL